MLEMKLCVAHQVAGCEKVKEIYIYIYINSRKTRDCLYMSVAAGQPVWLCGCVCVIALLHLLILGKCYAVRINASSL